MNTISAFAPGGIGNMGPGLDVFGCALEGPGDTVSATRTSEPGVRIAEPGFPDLPTDPARHASGIAASEVLRLIGARNGVSLSVKKELPLAGGQGGSAASSVAAAVAVNALFGKPLDDTQVLLAALSAESSVAGRHADNVSGSFYGGIVIILRVDPLEVIRLPVPDSLRIVLVHPHYRVSTADSRRVLPTLVERPVVIHQLAHVAAMVAALHSGDVPLFGRAVDDRIAEPARGPLLPGFADAKRAALDAGAFGASISGGGPSAFAVVDRDDVGEAVSAAMVRAYAAAGIASDGRVTRIDRVGARVVPG